MLDIIPALLLVTGTVFLVLLILLNKTLYKPLLEFIDNRNNSINRDLENAGKNASDVVAYYKEVETILSEGKMEAAKIREAALNEAKEKAAKKVEQKKSDLEAQSVAFFKALESEKDEFKNGLLAQMPLFKESVAAKLSHI
ncbi:MAG: FoF1 ATP synthase subunit B' [Sulfurospirillum sp.]|jgi:F-type H+-transporting ATPase subunit b|uniref:FoF1 ATP synthase subunit B' n=1 Tax=Sulfurospirillum sp. UCH001 TaxID=1581011 RepID=UPI000835292F|nr:MULTISPECIES: FoF1 ATP synthase subunit B' [unclassified Sulfurospirillum]WNY98171.1 FoF1 ATP synthase subunit B' [Sulfurospirillum sp. 'SP']